MARPARRLYERQGRLRRSPPRSRDRISRPCARGGGTLSPARRARLVAFGCRTTGGFVPPGLDPPSLMDRPTPAHVAREPLLAAYVWRAGVFRRSRASGGEPRRPAEPPCRLPRPVEPANGAPMSSRPKAVPHVHISEPHVRVTEWRFAPGAETGWHRHEADYVVVPMPTATSCSRSRAAARARRRSRGMFPMRGARASSTMWSTPTRSISPSWRSST